MYVSVENLICFVFVSLSVELDCALTRNTIAVAEKKQQSGAFAIYRGGGGVNFCFFFFFFFLDFFTQKIPITSSLLALDLCLSSFFFHCPSLAWFDTTQAQAQALDGKDIFLRKPSRARGGCRGLGRRFGSSSSKRSPPPSDQLAHFKRFFQGSFRVVVYDGESKHPQQLFPCPCPCLFSYSYQSHSYQSPYQCVCVCQSPALSLPQLQTQRALLGAPSLPPNNFRQPPQRLVAPSHDPPRDLLLLVSLAGAFPCRRSGGGRERVWVWAGGRS